MLRLYQHYSIVNWSDEDYFACNNCDLLWVTSILKEHSWCHIFTKHPRRQVLRKKALGTRKGLSPKFLFTKISCFYYFYFSYEFKFLE